MLDNYQHTFHAFFSLSYLNDLNFKNLQRVFIISNYSPRIDDTVLLVSPKRIIRGSIKNLVKTYEPFVTDTFTLPRHFLVEVKLRRIIQ